MTELNKDMVEINAEELEDVMGGKGIDNKKAKKINVGDKITIHKKGQERHKVLVREKHKDSHGDYYFIVEYLDGSHVGERTRVDLDEIRE